MQLVMEFYSNLEEGVDDKVFLRGKWINRSSEAINKLIGGPDHEEDKYSAIVDEGVETSESVKKLCQIDEEVIWATSKNN